MWWGCAVTQSKKGKEVSEFGEGVWLASSVKAQKCTRGEDDDEVQHLMKLRELNKLVNRHTSRQPKNSTEGLMVSLNDFHVGK